MAATNNAIKAYPETMRSASFGSITSSYTAIGTPFDNPIHLFILQNTTNQALFFSWNGTTDHMMLVANGQLVLDVSSNLIFNAGAFLVAKGVNIYVKYPTDTAPTTGTVYLSAFFGFPGGS